MQAALSVDADAVIGKSHVLPFGTVRHGSYWCQAAVAGICLQFFLLL